MGLNLPSLYTSFGTKAQLFIKAVDHYETVFRDNASERMASGQDVQEDMARFSRRPQASSRHMDAPCGCLVIRAATNVSEEGHHVTNALEMLRADGYQQFLTRIKRSIAEQQLPSSMYIESVAAALNTMLQGMSMQARDGASQDDWNALALWSCVMAHGAITHVEVLTGDHCLARD